MTLGFNEPLYTVSGTFEEEDIILEVPITNSGVYTADAYVYTVADNPFFNKISDSYSDNYSGLEDNILLTISKQNTYRFIFKSGVFIDTYLNENGAITLDNTNYKSTYNKWNKDDKCFLIFLTEADIRAQNNVSQNAAVRSVLSFNKGKWYWEVNNIVDKENFFGVGTSEASISPGDFLGKDKFGWSIGANGHIYNGTTVSSIGAPLGTFRVGIALDMDVGKIWFSRDGEWEGSGVPTTGANPAFANVSGTVYPMCSLSGTASAFLYLDSEDFVYTAPAGFNTTEKLISGYYLTPIFNYTNQLATSYLWTDDPVDVGNNFKVRSSNIKPLDLNELYCIGENGIYKYDLYLKHEYNDWPSSELTGTTPYSISVNTVNGNVAANIDTIISLYDREGAQLYNINNSKYRFDKRMEITKDGNSVWGYGETYGALIKLNISNDIILYEETYNIDRDDFIYDLSIEKNGDGIYYTNSKTNQLIHKSSTGVEIFNKSFNSPRAVATTSDDGCWVFDYGYNNFYRFMYYGSLVGSFAFDKNITYITTDNDDSIWFIHNDSVGHINLSGEQDKIINHLNNPQHLIVTMDYVVVHSSNGNSVIVLNKNDLSLVHTFELFEIIGKPAILNIDYENQESFNNNLLPLSYDPIWGDNSTLVWESVNKNPSILKNAKYHQLKIEFSNNESSIYPELRTIFEGSVIKLDNIGAGNSKNIYIKTNNINEAMDHTLSLRVSWEEFSGR